MKRKLVNPVQYYRNLTRPVKAGIWFLVCNVMQKGVTALTTPIYTRILSTEEYGKVSVFFSWQDIFGVFITMGLSSTVFAKGLIEYEDNKDTYTQIMASLILVVSSIYCIFYCVFHHLINSITGLSSYGTLLIFISSIAASFIEIYGQRKKVDYIYIPFVVLTLALTIAKPTISITVIRNSSFRDKALLRISLDSIITVCFGFSIMLMLLKKGIKINWKVWRNSLFFVVPLIPHYLSQRILNQSDRIMIERMKNNSEAGIYSLAYSVGMLLMLLNTAIDSTIGPWMYRKLKEKEFQTIRKLSYKLIIIFALITFLFSMIVPELVKIFATSDYYEAIYIVPIIALSSFYIFLYVQFVYVEYHVGKTQYIALVSIFCAILNLFLNYFYIPRYGYLAAAYTTLICYILYAIGHYGIMRYLCKKYLNINSIINFKFVLAVSIMLTILTLLCMKVYPYTYFRWGIALLMFAIILKLILKYLSEFQGGER